MTVKSNSNNPATKSDIRGLRSEFKRTEKSLRGELLRVEEKVENVEESQKRTEVILNKISNQLDGFVGRVDDLTNENEIGGDQIHELRKTAKDHEKRITKLETSN